MRGAAFAISLLIVGLPASVLAQPKCAADAAAADVLLRQADLLKQPIPEASSDVPVVVQTQLKALRSALVAAMDAEMACLPPNLDSATVQRRLAELLKANQPEKPFVPQTAASADSMDTGAYGDELKVAVSTPANALTLRAVQMSYTIECGTDDMLLMNEPQAGRWRRAIGWWSEDVKEISDAFGDWLLYAVVPSPGGIRVAVAHGTAWCQSRFSHFSLDLLALSADPSVPQVVWSTERDYSRLDFEPRLRTSGDTFELRLHADEMLFGPANALERLVVYRYRVSGDQVTRIEPVAANASGFIEEWLEMPWDEALAQSDPAQAGRLEALHKKYELSCTDADKCTYWHSGPVQACTARDRFQVKMTTEQDRAVLGKPGGDVTPGPTYYFQLQQDNGYRLLAITTTPDSSCSGPDLMKKTGVR